MAHPPTGANSCRSITIATSFRRRIDELPAIFLLLSLAFQSPLLGATALVPNGLPIFVVLGLLGWAGVRINMGTAMIAAVSLGLSVDNSIHYIARFRRHLADGGLTSALETAHRTAGRAVIFSTLALAAGFLALTTSGFMPTVSFGWLSCLTLLGGLAGPDASAGLPVPSRRTLATRPIRCADRCHRCGSAIDRAILRRDRYGACGRSDQPAWGPRQHRPRTHASRSRPRQPRVRWPQPVRAASTRSWPRF